MSDASTALENLERAVERTRWAVLVWLVACAIATQALTPPPPSARGSTIGLGAALALGVVIVVARGVARAPRRAPRARVRAFLTAYGASALLGALGLGIFFLRGDAAQALGCALAGLIFAAGGARTAARSPRAARLG